MIKFAILFVISLGIYFAAKTVVANTKKGTCVGCSGGSCSCNGRCQGCSKGVTNNKT